MMITMLHFKIVQGMLRMIHDDRRKLHRSFKKLSH
jgi:hypothetical protein